MKAYSENGDKFDFTITDTDGRDVADQFIPNLIDDATAIDDEFHYFVPEFKGNTANHCESLCEEEQKVLDAGKRYGLSFCDWVEMDDDWGLLNLDNPENAVKEQWEILKIIGRLQ